MSADSVSNPPPAESKSARKKKAKAEAEAAKTDITPAAASPADEETNPISNGDASSQDSSFVKELQK